MLALWVPLAAALTCAAVLSYGAGQQLNRQGLNDPQIQMVRDAANEMESGRLQPPDIVKALPHIDITKSLSPFIAIYDESGNLLDSSGVRGTNKITPPIGLFEEVQKRGEYLVSWQPTPTERYAIVLKRMNIESGWVVVAGRSMSVAEDRTQHLGSLVVAGWLVSLVITLIACMVSLWVKGKLTR